MANNKRSSHYHPNTMSYNVAHQSELEGEEEDNFNDMSYSSSIISNISNLLGNSSCFLTNAREFAEREEVLTRDDKDSSCQDAAEEEAPKFNLRELLKNTPAASASSKPSTVVRKDDESFSSFNLSDLSLTSANSFNLSRKAHKQPMPSILERSNEDSTKSTNGVRTNNKSSFYLADSSIVSPNSTISVPDMDMDSMVARILAPENSEKFRRSFLKHQQQQMMSNSYNQPNRQEKTNNTFDVSADFKTPIVNINDAIRKSSVSSKSSTSSSTKNRANTPDSWSKFDAHLNKSLAQINPEEIAFGSFNDADRLSVSDSEFQNLTPQQKNEFLNNDRKEQLYILNPVADSFSKSSRSQTLNQSKLTPLNEKEISMGRYFIQKSMKPWDSSFDIEDDLDETIKSEAPTKENVEPKQNFDMKRFSRDSAIVSAQTSLKERFSASNLLEESFFNSSRTTNSQERYSKFSNDLKRSMEMDYRGSTPLANKFKAKKQTPVNFVDKNSSFVSHTTSISRSQPVKIHPKKTTSTSTSTSMIQSAMHQQPQPQLQFQPAVPSTSNANQMTFQGTPQVVQASAYQMNPPNMQTPFYGLPIIIQIQCPMMQAHQQQFQPQPPNMNFTNNNL